MTTPSPLKAAMRALSACHSKDDLRTCYCPNCDNSVSEERLRAAIKAFLAETGPVISNAVTNYCGHEHVVGESDATCRRCAEIVSEVEAALLKQTEEG